MLWYGSIASIPNGWHLCNGEVETPDLQNNFIVGAGGNFDPNDSGGSNAHGHNLVGPFHAHTMTAGGAIHDGVFISNLTDQSRITGNTDWNDHRPPYKSLCYIMKLI